MVETPKLNTTLRVQVIKASTQI